MQNRFLRAARSHLRLTIYLLLTATPFVHGAVAPPLALEEAIAIGEQHSARISAQYAAVAAATEQVPRASQLPDPKLRLGIDNLPVSDSDAFSLTRDFMTMRRIGYAQDIPNAEKRQARDARAAREREVELTTLESQRAQVRQDIALAAQAADSPLTLVEAQRRAVERSRQVAGQDSAVLASREMAVAAAQLPDPALKIGLDNLPIEGTDRFSLSRDFMTMRRIGVMQEFTRADKRRYRAERFDREAERGLAEKTATVATVQRDTALAWLDRYYAEAMASVIGEQEKEARLEIEAADSAYRAGRGNQADVFAARSTVVLLEDRLSESSRRIRTAKTALARWIGEGSDAPLGGKPEIDRIRLDLSTLDTQLAHHPQIAVLDKQIEIARAEVNIAQANKKSDWSVELMYQKRGSAFSDMVSLGVAIPLQWDQKHRQDRELGAKLAMAAQAEAQRDEMLRAHVAEVRAQVQEWQSGLERRVRYERDLVALAKERTRAAVAAYRGGKAGLAADVLPARRNEIEVRMQALQLEMATAKLWAQLNFLFPEGSASPHSDVRTR